MNWFWIPKLCCWRFPPSGARAATRAGRWRLARMAICISASAIIPIPLSRTGSVRRTSGRTGAIGTPSARQPTVRICAAKFCASNRRPTAATVFLQEICSPRPKKAAPRFTSWACAILSGCRLTARAAGSTGAMSAPTPAKPTRSGGRSVWTSGIRRGRRAILAGPTALATTSPTLTTTLPPKAPGCLSIAGH